MGDSTHLKYKDTVNWDVLRFIDTVTSFPDRDGHVSENMTISSALVTATTLPIC